MIQTAPRLWRIVVSISVSVILIYAFFTVPEVWSWAIASLVVLGIGIPHGAADHHLFSALYQSRHGLLATWRFYAGYLGAILLVGLGWYLAPAFTLVAFIGLSAFHFGQAYFGYLPQGHWYTFILSISWGLWVIFTPIYFHWEEASSILGLLWGQSLESLSVTWVTYSWYLLSGMLAGCLLGLFKYCGWRDVGREMLSLVVLLGLYALTPLLLGFGLFFGLWHALPSAADQVRFLQNRHSKYTWQHYLWSIIPFAVVAIVSVLGIAQWLANQSSLASWWSIIFGIIAALTLPHMIILDRVYHQLEKEAA